MTQTNTPGRNPALTAELLDNMPAKEVMDKRERFTKVFSLEGNHYQAVTYTNPVHYRNAKTGEWVEIDNTFIPGRYKGKKCLRTRSGEIQVHCTASGSEPFLHLEEQSGKKISYGVQGAASIFPEVTSIEAAQEKSERAISLREKALEKQESSICYRGLFPGVDMICTASASRLKDTILFSSPSAIREVVFCFNVYGAQMTLDYENNKIAIHGDNKEVLFSMPAPFLMDAVGEKGDVKVELSEEDGIWSIRCIPDIDFLKDATFPVALDPAIYTHTKYAIEDSFVSSGSIKTNYNGYGYLWVEDLGSSYIKYSYLKVNNLPPINAANYITKAYLCMSLYSHPSEDMAVFLSQVNDDFSASVINYSNRPPHNSLYQDYVYTISSASLSTYYQFDVTNLVRKWYLGKDNPCVVLTPQPDRPNTVRFVSSEGTRSPYLVVNYNSMAGLEDYLQYESHNLGRAGTGHVSLYNGNLIFTHSDTSMNGKLLPVSINHVYNSCDAQEDICHIGYGWRTSMHLTLHRETIPNQAGTGIVYYVYTDSDGTMHHFKQSVSDPAVYEDLSGLSLKLTIDTINGIATMTDKGDNSTVFGLPTVDRTAQNAATESKMVKTITDALENTITITSDGMKIETVKDGANRIITFNYDANRCSSIQAPGQSPTECVRFGYDASGNLTTITHEDDVVTTYTYNANHLLLTAVNMDGRKILYTYENENASPVVGLPYRISQFDIKKNDTLINESRKYEYGSRMTKAIANTFGDGKSLTYHFNDYGNMVSVNDDLGQAVFATFSPDALPNHPESASRMQRVVTNLLVDHSIEDNSSAWVTGNNVGSGTFMRDQSVYHMGLVSRKITISAGGESYCKQNVTLTPGKGYTFSAYAKTTGDIRAFLRVSYTDGGVLQTVDSEPFWSLNDFTRISLSFTLPPTSASNVTCWLMCNTNAGSAWFDCVQLETGLTMNRYNLLHNSNFAAGGAALLPTNWVKAGTAGDSYYTTFLPSELPTYLTGRVVRLNGRYDRSIGLTQEFRAYGNEGDVYVAGGWTCGYGKEVKEITGRTIRNYINVLFGGGDSWTSGGKIYFNYEEGNWQFACGAVIAPRSYTYIKFEIQYYQQMNYADFTNMFLYKEEFGQTYTYDQNGNITNVKILKDMQSEANYDTFNNLISYVQPGRPNTVKTVLDYGSDDEDKKKHLLKQCTDPMGVVQTFEYNANGNLTLNDTQNSDGTSFIRGTMTYTDPPNYIHTQTDARGKTVTINTDPNKGTLNSVTDPNGQTVSYAYDARKRITATTATADSKNYKNEYVYDEDRLSEVQHNTSGDDCDVVYKFTYDDFGKPTVVKVGTQEQVLSTNTYDGTKGTLTSVTYGNGDCVSYTRDDLHRITGIRYEGDTENRFVYAYNAEGAASHVTDTILERTHRMEYDAAGRLMRVTTRGSSEHVHTGELAYDGYNNLSAFREKIGSGSTPYQTTYTYDNGNRPTTVQFGDANNKVGYGYDALGRISNRTLTVGGTNYASNYGFVAGGHGTGSTTAMVGSITQPGQNFTYSYDNVGNIATEVRGSYSTSYAYDNLGQLLRVNDQRAGETWTFEYDRGGNILNKNRYAYTTGTLGTVLETISYGYTDTNWKDKLTSYNGTVISYDEIGNPETDGTWIYEWQAGRQLAAMTKAGITASFTYNVDGLRVRKMVNSTVTDYTLHGKQVVHLKQGSNNLHFFYDAQGRPAIVEFAGNKYGYVHNLQGDIVALVDRYGAQVVEYTYDAWGKPLTTTGTLATTLGALNPFRYRGYVFDEETGLYYLRSRYYNPVWGRFLNADAFLGNLGDLLDHNIFEYCQDNPTCNIDESGCSSISVTIPTNTMPSIDSFLYSLGIAEMVVPWVIVVPVRPITIPKDRLVKTKSRTISLPDTQAIRVFDRPYQMAYVTKPGDLVRLGPQMSLDEALVGLGFAGATNSLTQRYTYNKGNSSNIQRIVERHSAVYGIYARSQADAKVLAVIMGCNMKPQVHGSGMFGHYHDITHTFHIWYGEELSY